MSKLLIFGTFIIVLLSTASYFYLQQQDILMVEKVTQQPIPTVSITPTPTEVPLPQSKIIPQELQVYQSFNNCGPASLSMLLSYFNINASQAEVGQNLRPYQNSVGNNDDKSVTLQEMAAEAKKYNLIPYHRANGDLDIVKKLIANNIPFIVRTWLNPDEDIGHYRVVRGYDERSQEFIQDDSYQGDDIRYSYTQFLEMWQPFNYEYLVLINPEQERLVKEILQENTDEKTAWQNALEVAQNEELNSQSIYPIFNQSIAYYYLGDYQKSVEKYEAVESRLPSRMLWYQTEPIKAYLETKQYDKVFALTDAILNNQNRAFTELYLLRGRAYEEQGNIGAARNEYVQASYYNKNSQEAKDALEKISNSSR